MYKPGLSQRPTAVIVNKMDVQSARENFETIREQYPQLHVYPISAKYGDGIDGLMARFRHIYDQHLKPPAS